MNRSTKRLKKTSLKKKASLKKKNKSKSNPLSVYGYRKEAQYNNYSVNIINSKLASETAFGGYPLDLLFGIIYLKRKHPTKITLPFNIRKLLEQYSSDLDNRIPFTFIGCLFYKCKDSLIDKEENKKYNPRDFELELPGKISKSQFKALLLKAKASKKRYTIIPLLFRWNCSYTFEGHANLLFFDFKKMTCERFEPYGWISAFTEDEMQVSNGFNRIFNAFIKSLDINLTFEDQYISVKKGLQFLEESEVEKKKQILVRQSDPEGYCGAWSLWYADLRLSNPNKSKEELIKRTLEIIRDKKQSLRGFIRNYSVFLVKERHKLLKKIKQKNPYNHVLRDQLKSLENKKSDLSKLVKTAYIINK